MKPRLLFLTSRDPYADVGGDRLRARHLVAQLAREYEVSVWWLGAAPRAGTLAAGDGVTRSYVAAGAISRGSRLMAAAFDAAMPLQVALNDVAAMHRACATTSRSFDVVFCHLIRMAPYLRHFHALRVLDFCDAVSENARQTAQHSAWWSPWGWVNAIEAPRAQRYERALAGCFDLATVASQADADLLALPSQRCLIVPQGISGGALRAVARSDRPEVMFLGRMNYFPNRQAAHWFAREVMPRAPELGLRLIGPVGGAVRARLERQRGVTVLGRVKDLSAASQGCALAIAPMRVATGLQSKILDYLALGLPVVASPEAVRGLPLGPQAAGIELAETPRQWAERLRALIADPAWRERLSVQGLNYVHRHHDWDAIGASLLQRLCSLRAARPAAAMRRD
jgi:glycosyltransferase involved in cell wall biosynthesis